MSWERSDCESSLYARAGDGCARAICSLLLSECLPYCMKNRWKRSYCIYLPCALLQDGLFPIGVHRGLSVPSWPSWPSHIYPSEASGIREHVPTGGKLWKKLKGKKDRVGYGTSSKIRAAIQATTHFGRTQTRAQPCVWDCSSRLFPTTLSSSLSDAGVSRREVVAV